MLGPKGTLGIVAEALGGVRGFSLKNIAIIIAATVPIIACTSKDKKIWY